MRLPLQLYCFLVMPVVVLAACAPATPTPSPAVSTPSIPPATATVVNEPYFLEAGLRYRDPMDEALISFLDVIAFQATVDEATETAEVVLTLRDIPPSAPRGLVKNVIEYQWGVSVYLNPYDSLSNETPADYFLQVLTFTLDPSAGVNPTDETNISVTADPTIVPFDQLWTGTTINNQLNESIGILTVITDPHSDTLTIRGILPGITSGSTFRFITQPYGGAEDLPDDFIPSGPATNSGVARQATQFPSPLDHDTPQLVPAGAVRAYPGPEHYAGDILTFEVLADQEPSQSNPQAQLTLDDNELFEVTGQWRLNMLVLPLALDTRDLLGAHTLRIEAGNGSIDQVYEFEVLPASQRPALEAQAAWQSRVLPCCILNYISGTAAARDIDLLARHFQQAAEDITGITGREIDRPLKVYFIDRMWGNGGFGGNGELVVSYTDRYYGPTVDMEGWETLARHEITHALGVDQGDDGYVVYNEGLAVFLAGGHFKPEPLAERGAALYDLGFSVPVGQGIDQHELNYLFGAAVMMYIHETYGPEALWKFVNTADVTNIYEPEILSAAIQAALGISPTELDRDFQAWLQGHDPGDQLEDLRLTVKLQDVRRQYQNTHAPPPGFIFESAANAVARPEYLPVVIRESRLPANIAIELMIANGQKAIVEGDYATAEQLIKILDGIISTGAFEDALAKDYFEIVTILAEAGYEVVSLQLQGDQASAHVTMEPPIVTSLELQKLDGIWQVKPQD